MDYNVEEYRDETFEREFISEVIEKKKIARSASARASRKKGFKGNVMFPFDMLSGKAKKNFLKQMNGEVKVYNMYDNLENLIDYSHFKLMDKHDRKEMLEKYLEHHSAKDISEHWGVKPQQVHDQRYLLKIEPKQRIHKKGEKSQMIQGMITFEQYKDLDKENRKIILEKYLKAYNNDKNKLADAWGCTRQRINDQLRIVGSDSSEFTMRKSNRTGTGKKKIQEVANNTVTTSTPPTNETISSPIQPITDMNTFTINLNTKNMFGEDLSTRILQIASLIIKDKKYDFTFSMKEKI